MEFPYDNQFFKPLDEFVLTVEDATELVNAGIAVIDYIYTD